MLFFTTLVITIWIMAAIKASHEQLPSMEKQLLRKLQIRTSRPEVFCKTMLWKFCKISNSTCAGVSFSIKLQATGREHLFYRISPDDCFLQISPEELFRRFWKIFQKPSKKIPLEKSCFKNDVNSRPGNLVKAPSYCVKTMTYVAYMWKIILLTGTSHSHEFWENSSCVTDPAEYLLFVSKIVLFFGF